MKKGSILSQLPGIVIAILILLPLGYFGLKFIYGDSNNIDKQNAIAFSDSLKAKIDALPQETTTSLSVQGFDGNNVWYLAAFSEDQANSPDRCLFKSCLCSCKASSQDSFNPKEDCQAGICTPMKEKNLMIEIKIDPLKDLNSAEDPNKIPDPYIFLQNKLINLNIEKKQDSIKITQGA